MSDSGKHRSLASKQNSDGTFEFVMKTVEEDFMAMEESEVSEAVVDAPPVEKVAASPIRILVPIVAVTLLIVMAGFGYWAISSKGGASADDDLTVVPGFKAYKGGASGGRAVRPSKTKTTRPEPRPKPPVIEPKVAAKVEEEATANDPGPVPVPSPDKQAQPSQPYRMAPMPSALVVPENINGSRFKEARNLSERLKMGMPKDGIDPARIPMGLQGANLKKVPRDTDGDEIAEEDGVAEPGEEDIDDPPRPDETDEEEPE